jgi:hypothetical protein
MVCNGRVVRDIGWFGRMRRCGGAVPGGIGGIEDGAADRPCRGGADRCVCGRHRSVMGIGLKASAIQATGFDAAPCI